MPCATHHVRRLVSCGGLFCLFLLCAARGAGSVQVLPAYHHDVSRPLRELAALDQPDLHQEREAAENPKIPNAHVDQPDLVVEKS